MISVPLLRISQMAFSVILSVTVQVWVPSPEIAQTGVPAQVPYVNSVALLPGSASRLSETVEGTEASYQMASDDLYVRARVESSPPGKFTRNFYPAVQTAWTQPYAVAEPVGLTPASESSSGSPSSLNTQTSYSKWRNYRPHPVLSVTALGTGLSSCRLCDRGAVFAPSSGSAYKSASRRSV